MYSQPIPQNMDIKSFYEPDSGTWTHLLADPIERVAAVIDPVWVFDPVSGVTSTSFIDRVLEEADRSQYDIQWVLETHAHADHLTAADLIRKRTGAKIACGKGICQVQQNFVRVFDMRDTATDGSQFDRLLVEGDTLKLGELEIRVIETPGHTGDSVTYRVGDAAFIGDTLFAPGFGTARCDFPGGNAGLLFDSISRICSLPPETRLFLCHDYPGDGAEPVSQVTVAETLAGNIHFGPETRREEYVAMREGRDAKLALPRLILPSLQVNIRAGDLPKPESNGVHYLRTPVDQSIESLIGIEK
jgi:glyoxylase-like metal-dependent hydrolase (beta-lactamase superfamily II)